MNSRRDFLKTLSLTGLSLGILPGVPLLSFAKATEPATKSKKVLVVIFQRGAMDGLSMLPPIEDPFYRAARPNIALHKDGEMPASFLEGAYYLHPQMKDLLKYWNEGTLAFIPQVGSPSHTRSHFDAQDFMEIGTPDEKNTPDGFLNRALQLNAAETSSLRAIALQASMPRILQGAFPAISLDTLKDYTIRQATVRGAPAQGFEEMYAQATDKALRGVGQEVFDSISTIKTLQLSKDQGSYPKTPLAKHLREIADVIKSDLGLQVAVTEMGGWDTHVNQGGFKGSLGDRLRELSEALHAFNQDLGPRYQDVCVVTVTEFGRTVKENGNRGTDHGHGSVMMVMGGNIRGHKIYGDYKELRKENLFEERDVPVTTDFRDIFSEILEKHLGYAHLEKIFPHYRPARKWSLYKA